jgi:beta-mannosidase
LKGVDLPSQGFVVMRTRTADGQDAREVITPEEFVNADLVDPEITISVDSVGIDGRYPITVSSNALSVFTTLEADLPGTFSDNMTVIWPDAPAEIFFTPADAALGKPRFSAKDLWQSTYPQGSKPCQ